MSEDSWFRPRPGTTAEADRIDAAIAAVLAYEGGPDTRSRTLRRVS